LRFTFPRWQGDSRDLTKLPLKLFHDYSPDGSLYTILSACFAFKEAQHLRRFEFQNPQKKERNLQLIGRIEDALVVPFRPPVPHRSHTHTHTHTHHRTRTSPRLCSISRSCADVLPLY
jgi:hypothetical protein